LSIWRWRWYVCHVSVEKGRGEYTPLWDSGFEVVLFAGGIAVCGESLSAFEVVGEEFEDGGGDGGVE